MKTESNIGIIGEMVVRSISGVDLSKERGINPRLSGAEKVIAKSRDLSPRDGTAVLLKHFRNAASQAMRTGAKDDLRDVDTLAEHITSRSFSDTAYMLDSEKNGRVGDTGRMLNSVWSRWLTVTDNHRGSNAVENLSRSISFNIDQLNYDYEDADVEAVGPITKKTRTILKAAELARSQEVDASLSAEPALKNTAVAIFIGVKSAFNSFIHRPVPVFEKPSDKSSNLRTDATEVLI